MGRMGQPAGINFALATFRAIHRRRETSVRRSERRGTFHLSREGPPRTTDPPPRGAASVASVGGSFISVVKGRPERLIRPPGGSERSERGGKFHPNRW